MLTANLYGTYLRDMLVRERRLDGSYGTLIFRDADAYTLMDMNSTFLRNEIIRDTFADGADLGRFDLSALYLRGIGLQGVELDDILKTEKNKYDDCFLHESYQEK